MSLSLASSGLAIAASLLLASLAYGENQETGQVLPDGGFPCATYSARTAAQLWPRLHQAGIDISGPEYENVRASAAVVAGAGIPTIATIDSHVRFVDTPGGSLDEAQLAKDVKALAPLSKVVAWYLQPEEIRPWKSNEMQFFRHAVNAIHQADPSNRPVFTYDPGNRDAAQMTATGEIEDILARGIYPNYAGFGRARVYVRWSIDQMSNAQRELRGRGHTVLLWPVLEMFANSPVAGIPVQTLVRHDVLSVLAGGAQGIMIFSMRPRSDFTDYNAYLEAYLKSVGDVCGQAPLGLAALHGVRSDLPLLQSSVGNESFKLDDHVYAVTSMRATDFRYQNKRWLIIVNSSTSKQTALFGATDLPKNALLPPFLSYDKYARRLRTTLGPLEAEVVQLLS